MRVGGLSIDIYSQVWYPSGIHPVTSPLPTSHGPTIQKTRVQQPLLSLQEQIHMVHNSATENALALNPAKCKALIISPSKVSPAPTRILADQLNAWNIGGCGTFQPPRLWTKKLGGPTYFAYELSRES